MMKESDGTWKHVETIYSSEAVADKAIRGLDAKPADFAFYFRDIYDNHTDTLYKEMTPLLRKKWISRSLWNSRWVSILLITTSVASQ